MQIPGLVNDPILIVDESLISPDHKIIKHNSLLNHKYEDNNDNNENHTYEKFEKYNITSPQKPNVVDLSLPHNLLKSNINEKKSSDPKLSKNKNNDITVR